MPSSTPKRLLKTLHDKLNAKSVRLLNAYIAVSLLLGVIAGQAVFQLNQQHQDEYLRNASLRLKKEIINRFQRYEYGLASLQVSINTVGLAHYQRSVYRKFNQLISIQRQFPGSRGFGIIRKVAPGQLQTFLHAAERDDRPGFELMTLGPNAGDRWIIQYIESDYAGANAAEGLDIASEPARKNAMMRAITTGRPAITDPITLVQPNFRHAAGFLLLSPIIDPQKPRGTTDQQYAATDGMTYALLHIDDLLHDFKQSDPLIAIRISQHRAASPTREYFFESQAEVNSMSASPIQQVLAFYSNEWLLEVYPTSALASTINPFSPLLIGLLSFSVCLSMLILQKLVRINNRRKSIILENQSRYQRLVNNALQPIIGLSPAGFITTWNHAATDMLGYTQDQVIGRHLLHILSPLKPVPDFHALSVMAESEMAEICFRTRLKEELSTQCYVNQIHDENGDTHGMALRVFESSVQQMSERKLKLLNEALAQKIAQQTQELETARQTLITILNGIPSLISVWDHNLYNVYVNLPYAEFIGRAPEDVTGQHFSAILGEEVLLAKADLLNSVLAGNAQHFEQELPAPDGTQQHLIINYIPRIINDVQNGFFAILNDVTELIENRKTLELAREQQLHMDKMSSLGLMVAGVAHELNTPLGGAMLYTQRLLEDITEMHAAAALLDGQLLIDPAFCDRVNFGLSKSLQMLERSSEIIRQFKQVSSDRANSEFRTFDLVALIQDVLHLLHNHLKLSNVRVETRIPDSLRVHTDAGAIGQVLQNLIDNAINHAFEIQSTEDRTITLSLSHDEEASQAKIDIADNGKGIPAEVAKKMWDPFFTTKRGLGGTGLGLHIVHSCVTGILKGEIAYAASAPPVTGSIFSIRIPLNAEQAS